MRRSVEERRRWGSVNIAVFDDAAAGVVVGEPDR